MLEHLPPAPSRVLEVGYGGGELALGLSTAGHGIVAIDPEAPDARSFVASGSRSGHICGYDFGSQGLTYRAFRIYYARPGRERKDLRAIIYRLEQRPASPE